MVNWPICLVNPSEDLTLWFGGMFFLILLLVTLIILYRTKASLAKKSIIFVVSFFFGIVPVTLVTLFIGIFVFESIDDPIASKYFVLNAAVKNTCYLDPEMNHCPMDLSELLAIQPGDFEAIIKGKDVSYSYYPQTNEYTLKIADSWYNGVIFDPYFKSLGGEDFVDIGYDCNGEEYPRYDFQISAEKWREYKEYKKI